MTCADHRRQRLISMAALGGKYCAALTDGVLALRYPLGLSGPDDGGSDRRDNPARDDSAMLLHLDKYALGA